jgi:putative oxidoreductase
MNWLTKLHSDDIGKLLLRLSIGGLMLFHGIAKLRGGVGPIEGLLQSKGMPGFLAYGTYIGEVVAPILILIGLWTRPAALILCFLMVMAIGLVHPAQVMTVDRTGAWGIELNMLYFLGALALFFTGAGKYSVTRGQGPLN